MPLKSQAYRLDYNNAKDLPEVNTKLKGLWIKTDEMIQSLFTRLKAAEALISELNDEVIALNSLNSQLSQAHNQVIINQDNSSLEDSNSNPNNFLPFNPTLPSFTPGSVIFAGPSGRLAQDNTNLFWDGPNRSLGIATNTPSGALEVQGFIRTTNTSGSVPSAGVGTEILYDGSNATIQGFNRNISSYIPVALSGSLLLFYIAGSEKVRINASGYVGIGTNNPSTIIHTKENAGTSGLTFENTSHGLSRMNFISGTKNWYVDHRGTVDSPNDRLAFSNDTSEVLSLLAGVPKVGIGNSTPTAALHLPSGTATASTSPLKFTSGTNLTTAEAGAVEYNGTNLFFTRAGTTRENVLIAIDNVGAPTTNAGLPTTRYGGDTKYLGDPDRWLSVNILGSTYKIPLYL